MSYGRLSIFECDVLWRIIVFRDNAGMLLHFLPSPSLYPTQWDSYCIHGRAFLIPEILQPLSWHVKQTSLELTDSIHDVDFEGSFIIVFNFINDIWTRSDPLNQSRGIICNLYHTTIPFHLFDHLFMGLNHGLGWKKTWPVFCTTKFPLSNSSWTVRTVGAIVLIWMGSHRA